MKTDLRKLIIRVEVLTMEVGGACEDVDRLIAKLDRLITRIDKLEKIVIDGNAALMSAILNLAPRTA